MESIVLGGGCFWCLDASFKIIDGVVNVISGYSGGEESDADYIKVGNGYTAHAEVVQVYFNPEIILLKDILDVFWAIHDPTTLNRQGNDVGSQYRSVIFYSDENQKAISASSIEAIQKLWDDPVVTQLLPLDKFYTAEEYHQNYYENNPGNGYCEVIINPKLLKLRQKFAERIKV